jgi:hypothetical protein
MIETFIASSSHLDSATYDSDARSLQVTFRDGQVWEYQGVPYETWLGLQNARSSGEYFHRQIRSSFPSEPA